MSKPKKVRAKKKAGRIHLRVSEALEQKMHDYVERHSTSLSAVATQLFEQLLAAEEQVKYDAEQV